MKAKSTIYSNKQLDNVIADLQVTESTIIKQALIDAIGNIDESSELQLQHFIRLILRFTKSINSNDLVNDSINSIIAFNRKEENNENEVGE